jgi:hypothetical protein
MKSAAQTKRKPSKETAKASRKATPAPRAKKTARPKEAVQPDRPPAVQPEAARPTAPDVIVGPPMPDLTSFGVDQRDAQAHVGGCDHCGRAHRHVLKNPKDAMALQYFGRNIAACLARKQAKAPA